MLNKSVLYKLSIVIVTDKQMHVKVLVVSNFTYCILVKALL